MFRDYGHWNSFRNSPLFVELADGYKKKTGNEVITLTYYGERHVTSNREINKPEDMKALKIRVPDAPLYTMFPRAVGANPTPIAFAEVYLALASGTVDAQENPLPTIQAKKFYEVQKHIMLTGHITDALLTIVGGPTWGKLSAEERKTLDYDPEGSGRQMHRRHREVGKGTGRLVQATGQGGGGGRSQAVPRGGGQAA